MEREDATKSFSLVNGNMLCYLFTLIYRYRIKDDAKCE